jgi:hypothetical protein
MGIDFFLTEYESPGITGQWVRKLTLERAFAILNDRKSVSAPFFNSDTANLNGIDSIAAGTLSWKIL